MKTEALVQRHDILCVQKVEGELAHEVISAGTSSRTVHVSWAISPFRAAEMHFSGLRTVKVTEYESFRILRPRFPDEMLPAFEATFRQNWREFRWKKYGIWQGFCQGFRRLTGVRLPFAKEGFANCSEYVGAGVKMAIDWLQERRNRYGDILSAPPDEYGPARLEDDLLVSGLYQETGLIFTGKYAERSPVSDDISSDPAKTPENT